MMITSAYRKCCECSEQATVMQSAGTGSSMVAVWYCAKHSPIKPLQSGIDRIIQLERDLAAAQAEVAQTKSFVAALQGLHAGDVETLMVERDALRERANALLHQIDIGDYVDSEGHVLKNNIAVLTLMKALTNA